MDSEECSICLEPLHSRTYSTLNCLHKFHDDCIKDWMYHSRCFTTKKKCPICNIGHEISFTTIKIDKSIDKKKCCCIIS